MVSGLFLCDCVHIHKVRAFSLRVKKKIYFFAEGPETAAILASEFWILRKRRRVGE